MTRDDIIRMALEALEYYRSGEDYQPTPASEAIDNLRAALAKPVDETTLDVSGATSFSPTPAKWPVKEQHNCTLDSPSDVYGIAMDICYEKDDGTFWVSNGEYASQVNYCPVCGSKAPKQVEQPK
jgi:hypothetical protein